MRKKGKTLIESTGTNTTSSNGANAGTYGGRSYKRLISTCYVIQVGHNIEYTEFSSGPLSRGSRKIKEWYIVVTQTIYRWMEPPSISDVYNKLAEHSPAHLPDCCSSLSVSLLKRLASLLPPDPALTLSIGSGSGLDLKAVEVPTTTNKYMPANRLQIVNGYRDLCDLAADASAWMFVYPRDIWLLREYVQVFGGQKCHLIIWIGPRADQLESEFFGEMWIKASRTTRLWHCGGGDQSTMMDLSPSDFVKYLA